MLVYTKPITPPSFSPQHQLRMLLFQPSINFVQQALSFAQALFDRRIFYRVAVVIIQVSFLAQCVEYEHAICRQSQ